jgi:hypothetical protein
MNRNSENQLIPVEHPVPGAANMSNSNLDWNASDELILSGLAAGLTHTETAELANVSSKTIQRRVTDEAFATEIARRRGQQVERITGRLSELSSHAVDTLTEALDDDSPTIRLRAADLTLNWLVKLRREADLERRIAEIEHELATDTTAVTS